jgi:antitoxin ParD1/3/4
MASSSLHISLPEPLKAYVDAQVESGDYGTPSDFLRELIQNDRDQQLAQLEERLLKNLQSKPIPISDEELAQEDFLELCRSKLRQGV